MLLESGELRTFQSLAEWYSRYAEAGFPHKDMKNFKVNVVNSISKSNI